MQIFPSPSLAIHPSTPTASNNPPQPHIALPIPLLLLLPPLLFFFFPQQAPPAPSFRLQQQQRQPDTTTTHPHILSCACVRCVCVSAMMPMPPLPMKTPPSDRSGLPILRLRPPPQTEPRTRQPPPTTPFRVAVPPKVHAPVRARCCSCRMLAAGKVPHSFIFLSST